ncbi:MAG: UDP-N-acetylglucosamine 2-epimerase, partial [bacterium]
QPDRVFNVGAMFLDNLYRRTLLEKAELEKQLGISLQKDVFLLTYHPETLTRLSIEEQLQPLLAALDKFPEYQLIFTKANADAGGRRVNQLLEEYCAKRKNSSLFVSLGSLRYLSLLKYVTAVIGNSSSGILEVPYFYKPTVNIGDRQSGRLRPASVIDCGFSDIAGAIQLALSSSFKSKVQAMRFPYGEGRPGEKIKNILKAYLLQNDKRRALKKVFYDIKGDF